MDTPKINVSVRRYNPFDLQQGSSQDWHNWLQEVIFYAESRLRRAVIGIRQQDRQKQTYLQQFLHRELVGQILLLKLTY